MKGRVRDWLRQAFTGRTACAPPEAFLPSALAAAPPDERRRLEEHAATCPACAWERTLAEGFEPAPEQVRFRRAEVDAIVARLETAPARHRPIVARWALAAAAVIGIGIVVGTFMPRSGAPALPARQGGGSVVRGGHLENLAPVGEIETLPQELRWDAVAGADRYRVRAFEVDGAVFLDATTRETRIVLPDSARSGMHPRVSYRWEVSALDPAGAIVASSGRVRFRAGVGRGHGAR